MSRRRRYRGQSNGFAQAQVARAVVAVVFVDIRIDRQIQTCHGLPFIRPDVDASADTSKERRATLVVGRGPNVKARITRLDRQAAGQQGVRLGWATVAG